MIVLCALIVFAVFSYVLKDLVERLCSIEDKETVAAALKILKSGKLPSLTKSNLLNTKFSELIKNMSSSAMSNSTVLQKP